MPGSSSARDIILLFRLPGPQGADSQKEWTGRLLAVAIDELAERFGSDVVYRADDLSKPRRVGLAPTLDFLDNRTRG